MVFFSFFFSHSFIDSNNLLNNFRLNEDIKNEYQSQMRLFQELREKYNQKVSILADENEKLQAEVRELQSKIGEQIQSD